MKSKIPLFVLPVLCGVLGFAQLALAVPPPDFLMSVGSQVAYIFSFVAVLFSAALSMGYQFLRLKYQALKLRPWMLFLLLLVLFGAIFTGWFFYQKQKEEKALEDWLQESQVHAEVETPVVEESVRPDPKVHPEPELSFLELNENAPLSISNEAFQDVLESGKDDFIVLDARENLENEYGHFPGSIHIRYADLKAGKIDALPTDKTIYVLCWSGMRGSEVTQLLRSYGLTATYLEGGADSWVEDFGGLWEGEIKFSASYPDKDYAITFTTEETRQKMAEGVILVDAREQAKQNLAYFGAIPMPIMDTPSEDLEAMYAQLPASSTVITVCDEYVNCFMAKLVGVELQRRGHVFLGRTNRPWEF